ncbi:MAG: regulatory iron-sulfur-containing complex subunit RicT [Planctomycetota bacterium]
MTSRNDEAYRRGNEVIVRSDRGVEVGQVLCEATEDALSHLDSPPSGSIVRMVSQDDTISINEIDGERYAKIAICKKHIAALELKMKLIDVESLFGGERVVVFYLSEERVDFRELVKLLAGEFKTRIEMRQIGVRDEAKLLADYGDCGKPTCCNTHLVTMPPVSMKMAKLQKATLDPTKISGRCGRLKCCLRYEFDTYEEIQKQLPRVGAHIVTANGRAKVLNQQIIAEQLLIETEDHRRMVIDASEVLSVIKKPVQEKKKRPNKDVDQKGQDRKSVDREKDSDPDEPNPAKSKNGPSDSGNQNGNGKKGGRKSKKRRRKGPSNKKGGSD